MFSILFSLIVIVYFIKFHQSVLLKLGLSQRDDSLMMIGLFVGLVFRNVSIFLDALLTSGVVLIYELVIALIFIFLIKSRYDQL